MATTLASTKRFSPTQLVVAAAAVSAVAAAALLLAFAATPDKTVPVVSQQPGVLQGDVNGDSVVNTSDLSVLLTNINKTTDQSTNATADANRDGVVNTQDLSVMLSNYGKSATTPANTSNN
jgi:hypothetical protein